MNTFGIYQLPKKKYGVFFFYLIKHDPNKYFTSKLIDPHCLSKLIIK